MFEAQGVSYFGDFIRPEPAREEPAKRIGSFMRPANLIPDASVTTLFYDTRFVQAFLQTAEFIAGGGISGTPLTVTGHHRDIGLFNVSFCDGHTEKVKVLKKGTMVNPNTYNARAYPLQKLMARGNGWRIDCFPERLVLEYFGRNNDPKDP
jgi:prepilin-type processing-associated H-X9-DG protein